MHTYISLANPSHPSMCWDCSRSFPEQPPSPAHEKPHLFAPEQPPSHDHEAAQGWTGHCSQTLLPSQFVSAAASMATLLVSRCALRYRMPVGGLPGCTTQYGCQLSFGESMWRGHALARVRRLRRRVRRSACAQRDGGEWCARGLPMRGPRPSRHTSSWRCDVVRQTGRFS